ncbi:CAP-Gly domain-containing protein [Xylariomycetidae sp. FL0641]|nr:CAP-Gly domain-containing protein [Xylariomycetidae sp. FL0641]
MSDIAAGQKIQLSDGRNAIVRFVGQTHFAAGDWVGVELEDESGKNDGSVQGERYFDCFPGRGMFVRPAAVTILQAAPAPAPRANPTRRPSRAGTMTGRPASMTDPTLGKRMSLNAPSPSPVTRTSRPGSIGRSPTKSPTKQLGLATAGSSAATSRTNTPSNTRGSGPAARHRPTMSTSRSSMGPPALPSAPTRRQPSISNSRTAGTTRPPGRPSISTGRGPVRPLSGRVMSGDSQSGNEAGYKSDVASPNKSDGENATSPVTRTKGPAAAKTPAGASARTPSSATAASPRTGPSNAVTRENEDLKAKLKVLERKRAEDREKIMEVGRLQEQRDKFEMINKKIEAKFQATAQENAALQKQLKEAEASLNSIEALQAEHDSVMELATLDREMAEENAEVFKMEVDTLKQKLEELELEVEILREENAEYSQGMSTEERESTGWLQMERSNERLRQALIRLRDLTEQQDEENKAQIKSLQSELEEFDALKEEHEIAKEKVLEAEARAEDLRQQLDDNLGAEAVIEQLSYEKLQQSEQINELKAVIDDLEALKEINDELEVNHVQNEKEMQQDLDFKDNVITEQARRAAEKDDIIGDLEYTMSRFRELVTTLQTDLEDMRASHAVNEAEAQQLSNTSQMMNDLKQKVQISHEKAQAKTIDLELQRMDAQEAHQHLEIVKMFLPDSFSADRDSVLALLRFRRLGFKSNLLNGLIKERISARLHTGHEDDLFAGCDALDKLSWVSSMCSRFVNAISHCSLEEFAKYRGALYELEPVERNLEVWIGSLRKGELKEKQCASELTRTLALMTHLGEVHITEGLESFADEIQMKTTQAQSHLESAATIVSATKEMVQRVLPPASEEDEMAQMFAKRVDAVVSQTRSTKVVVSKTLRSLEDLRARSLALTPDTAEAFDQCEATSQELVDMARKVGIDLHALLSDESRTEPFTYAEIQSTVQHTIQSDFASAESDLFLTYLSKLRVLTGQVTDLAAVAADLSQTQEFERSQAPWVLRAQEIKASKTIPVDTEEELRQLKDHYNEARRAIAMRDESLGTANLRIETLEARMRDANAKASRMADLEAQIAESQEQIVTLQKDLEQQDREAKALEADRDNWKKIAGDSKAYGDAADASGNKVGQERAVATAREIEELQAEIEALEGTVKYLREQNFRIRVTDPNANAWLYEPLTKAPSIQAQRRKLVNDELKECQKALCDMTLNTQLFDAKQQPKNRQAWRPAHTTAKYQAQQMRTKYEAWTKWRADVAEKVKLVNGPMNANKTGYQEPVETQNMQQNEKPQENKKKSVEELMAGFDAAKLRIRLPGQLGKEQPAAGGEVRIQSPSEWENLQGRRVSPS